MAPPVPTIHSSPSSIPQFINRLKIAKKGYIFKIVLSKQTNKKEQKNSPFWIISKSLFVAASPQLGPLFKPLAVFHQYYSISPSVFKCLQPTFSFPLPQISPKQHASYARLKQNLIFIFQLHLQERDVSEQLLCSLLKPVFLIRLPCLARHSMPPFCSAEMGREQLSL